MSWEDIARNSELKRIAEAAERAADAMERVAAAFESAPDSQPAEHGDRIQKADD
jgi:hypothetical protein